MKYCKNCGKELADEAVVCPNCGVPQETQKPKDGGSIGWAILGFLIWPVGAVLWFLWRKSKPKNAKMVGMGALVAIVLTVIGSFVSPSDNKGTNTQSGTTASKTEMTAEQKKQALEDQKKKASDEAVKILSELPKFNDEVEKSTCYTPYKDIPSENTLYWYAIEKDNKVQMRTKIVNFSTDINWVFWDTLIFSTADKNWEYKIKGGVKGLGGGRSGKSTKVELHGKYEVLDVSFGDLEPGYRLIVEGKNPIIRLKGSEALYDYHVSEGDINHLKTGLLLYDQLKVCNNTIIK